MGSCSARRGQDARGEEHHRIEGQGEGDISARKVDQKIGHVARWAGGDEDHAEAYGDRRFEKQDDAEGEEREDQVLGNGADADRFWEADDLPEIVEPHVEGDAENQEGHRDVEDGELVF